MPTKTTIKWRSIIGLLFLYIALLQDWQWIWGILFLMWAVSNIRSGTTYFIEFIEKSKNPILYWAIITTWILLAIYSFLPVFYPTLNSY